MSKQIMVPDIGADEVEVTEIMVAVGDKVELDQSIIAVEGDKASMEVPAPSAGIVKEILIKVGDKVATGSQIMIFEAEGAAAPAEVAAPVAAAPAAAPAAAVRKDVHVPDIGDDEVDVTEIMVAVGDMVEADQSIIAVEGDKA
ncbi:biotin/lipoyl-containing protein, partial [Aeromonas veronii]